MNRSVTLRQAVAYRLLVNDLTRRLPPGSYDVAARHALQDTIPRSALLSLHARVDACESSAWEDPRLVQAYSPRAAVHVLPRRDLGVFTVGRLPTDPEARRDIAAAADAICRSLGGRELRAAELDAGRSLRAAAASGRIAIRWTTRSLHVYEVPAPEIDLDSARHELCRRHVHACGPTTAAAFAWWSGITPPDAERTWRELARELTPVDVDGRPAWILTADEEALAAAQPVVGVRLLPSEELRLFARDRSAQFVPPNPDVRRLFDTFHPHGVVVDGAVVGAWGRRGGRVRVRVAEVLTEQARSAVEQEALAFPVPGATMRVDVIVG